MFMISFLFFCENLVSEFCLLRPSVVSEDHQDNLDELVNTIFQVWQNYKSFDVSI